MVNTLAGRLRSTAHCVSTTQTSTMLKTLSQHHDLPRGTPSGTTTSAPEPIPEKHATSGSFSASSVMLPYGRPHHLMAPPGKHKRITMTRRNDTNSTSSNNNSSNSSTIEAAENNQRGALTPVRSSKFPGRCTRIARRILKKYAIDVQAFARPGDPGGKHP